MEILNAVLELYKIIFGMLFLFVCFWICMFVFCTIFFYIPFLIISFPYHIFDWLKNYSYMSFKRFMWDNTYKKLIFGDFLK